VSPGINPEIFMSPEEFGLYVELALSVFPSIFVGLADREKEVMRAPPLSAGALATTVAVPSAPGVIVTIEGAAGGPKGRCQVVVICVLLLHFVRTRIRSDLDLLWQVSIEIVFEPGVPFGTAPI
jgi:hypothetical protein